MNGKIVDAHRLLRLPDEFSVNQLIEAYRALLQERHPDHVDSSGRSQAERTADTREIIEAYRLLMAWCCSVPFSITRDSSSEAEPDPEEFWKSHFGSDPLWGGPKK